MKKIFLATFAIFILTFANIVSARFDYLNQIWKLDNTYEKSEVYINSLEKKYWIELANKIITRVYDKVANMNTENLERTLNLLKNNFKNYNWEHKIILEYFKWYIEDELYYNHNFYTFEDTKLNYVIKYKKNLNIEKSFLNWTLDFLIFNWFNQKANLYFIKENHLKWTENLNQSIGLAYQNLKNNELFSNLKYEKVKFGNKTFDKISYYYKENKSYYENYYVLDYEWNFWFLQLTYSNPNDITNEDRKELEYIVENIDYSWY